jgi:hypothetical protein
MKTFREFQEAYAHYRGIINSANELIYKLKEEVIEQHCPYKIGETVEAVGYPNHGKTIIVDRIELKSPIFVGNGWTWRLHGRIVGKKSGKVGKAVGYTDKKVYQDVGKSNNQKLESSQGARL